MIPTKQHLRTLFAMVIAGASLGAKGLACGPCPDQVFTVPRLPPDNPDGSPPPPFNPDAVSAEECLQLCGTGYTDCEAVVLDGGAPMARCTIPSGCGAGRRPRGLRRPAARDPSGAAVRGARGAGAAGPVCVEAGAAAWLARAAHMEAASVRAFEALAEEIAALGAPPSLVRRARAAARQEARHARVVSTLARRRGAAVPAVRIRPGAARSKVALAIENAVEGCVGETFAALITQHQALAARDPAVRRAMGRIAGDEAGHAALAFAVDAWLRPQLGAAERRRVAWARARAAARLAGWTVDAETARELGLPGDGEGRSLAEALGRALGWAA